jgi:succinate dehydrogenase/fumarate reductase flavoprotein subunit
MRSLMWRNVGITRKAQPLAEAQEIIRFWHRYVMDKVFDAPEGWECQNMLTVSLLIAHAAGLRKESRGVHYRMDHTQTDDKHFHTNIEIAAPRRAVSLGPFGPLGVLLNSKASTRLPGQAKNPARCAYNKGRIRCR